MSYIPKIGTVDKSGIHFKTSNYDDNSSNGGVSSNAVPIQDLLKPLYEKIRVVGLESNLDKQSKITDLEKCLAIKHLQKCFLIQLRNLM